MNNNFLPQVASQVWNTPLLIEQGKLDTILAALGPLAAALRGELDEVVQTLTEAAAH